MINYSRKSLYLTICFIYSPYPYLYDMMDATLQSDILSGNVKFTAPNEESPGPGSANESTKESLQWRPKYTSFKEFMVPPVADFCRTAESTKT